MKDICRLCNNNAPLLKSHIIPKFVFKWLKETSATGHIRYSPDINKRVQDGLKLPWLCSQCEEKFSRYEKYFADKIFYPLHKNTDNLTYNSVFLKFAISLAWRVLKYNLETEQLGHLNDEMLRASHQALITWHNYLFNNVTTPGKYELHFHSYIGDFASSGKQAPINMHRYLNRSISYDVMSNSKIAFVYIKLPGLIIIGYISLLNSQKWRKTRICVRQGKIDPMSYLCSLELWQIIQDKAKEMEENQKKLSSNQKDKIQKSHQDKIQCAANKNDNH